MKIIILRSAAKRMLRAITTVTEREVGGLLLGRRLRLGRNYMITGITADTRQNIASSVSFELDINYHLLQAEQETKRSGCRAEVIGAYHSHLFEPSDFFTSQDICSLSSISKYLNGAIGILTCTETRAIVRGIHISPTGISTECDVRIL